MTDPFTGVNQYGVNPYAGISGYNPSYVSGQNSLASTQAQIAYQQALTQNQSDQLAFQRAQAAFTDAMSLGSAYGYSMGGNPYNFGSMMLPPAGTPLQSTINSMGYAGAIPGATGFNTGTTASYQQQLAAMAAQQAGMTGTYSAPGQSAYSPGTWVQLDPNSPESQQYGQQIGYVQPNGQVQRVGLAQAQQMGYDPSKTQAVTIPYQQFMSLAQGPPQSYMTQTQANQQQYFTENQQAQQAALAASQATGMYTAPGQIQAPGYASDGSSYFTQSPDTQKAYLARYGDPQAAMQAWVNDTNAAVAQYYQSKGQPVPGGPGAATETMAAQNQYFNQAQQLAQTYGQYYAPGAPGQAGTAGTNGPQAGQQTLAGQQQYFNENLQTQQFQQSAAQQYLQLLSQLQGPADYGQYLKVLGATPGGIQNLVGAAAGQFVPGTGVTGVAPQQQTLQNLVGAATGAYAPQGSAPQTQGFDPTQMAGYQPWMAQTLNQQMGGQQANGQMQSGQWTGGGQQYAPTDQPFSASGLPQNMRGGAPTMNQPYNAAYDPSGANSTYQSLVNAANGGAGAGYGAGATGTGGGSASQGGMNYNDFLAQAQGLPPPSQLSPQAFNNMLPSQQQMLGSMYSNLGYAKGDINALYNQSLPKFAAGSASGNFRLV